MPLFRFSKSKKEKKHSIERKVIEVNTRNAYFSEKLRLYNEMLEKCAFYDEAESDDDNSHENNSKAKVSKCKNKTSDLNGTSSFTNLNENNDETLLNLSSLSALNKVLSSPIFHENSPVMHDTPYHYVYDTWTLPKKYTKKFSVAGYNSIRLSQLKILETIYLENQIQMIESNRPSYVAKETGKNSKKNESNKKWKFSKSVYKSCPVCLEPMLIGQKLTKLSCKHYFHHSCYESSVKIGKICTFCQNPFDEKRVSSGRCEIL